MSAFELLGDPDAVVCEGDVCAVPPPVPRHPDATPEDAAPAGEPASPPAAS